MRSAGLAGRREGAAGRRAGRGAGRGRERLSRVARGRPQHVRCADRAPRRHARSRIHGDYHLGQLLVTDDGFVVIDFEGEPARPLAERRRPASPLRDVAGMLRSLDYAARTSRAQQPGFDADGLAGGCAGERSWPRTASRPTRRCCGRFELEKACYEVRYEANNRPDWVWLPLEAIERLVA